MSGVTEREAGEISVRLDHLEREMAEGRAETRAGFAEINSRLADGDAKFQAHEQERAAAEAVHKLAAWIAKGLFVGAWGAVLWVLTQAWPFILALFVPPKGH